jgi:hypothetical protein
MSISYRQTPNLLKAKSAFIYQYPRARPLRASDTLPLGLVFSDGSAMTNPSAKEAVEKLASL